MLLLAGAGCASNPAPVPVTGERAELTAMAGRWEGWYRSDETGRSGSIVFRLTAGGDSAAGDVLMTPAGGGNLVPRIEDASGRAPQPADLSKLLSISFVRLRGERVSGVMEPYTAPDCGCEVRTVFRGQARGDTISGTFRTDATGLRTRRGVWEVYRKR